MASRMTSVGKAVLLVASVVIVVAIALGVGLGIGLEKHDNNASTSAESTSSEPLASSTVAPPSSTSQVVSTITTILITPSTLITTTSSTAALTATTTTDSSQSSSTTLPASVPGTSISTTSTLLTSTQASTPTSSTTTTTTTSSSDQSVSPSSLTTSSITTSTLESSTYPSTSTTTYALIRATVTPANPVSTAGAPAFLGNVTSDNTFDIRDLGFQGNIGSVWINTYGDTIPCKGALQKGCFGLEAPNSASVATDDPLSYTDVNVNAKGHAEIFCPLLGAPEEPNSFGLGLTSVVQTGPDEGIVFYLRNNRSTTPNTIVGAGIGVISITSSSPVCTRPHDQWWDAATEPYYGDHDAILAPDGYIYAYGGTSSVDGDRALFLARVPASKARTLSAYEYWNGQTFTSDRLINPTEDQAVLMGGQGSIIWSEYYNMFLYFKPGCPGGACVVVQAAEVPQGPWSDTYGVWGTGDSPNEFLMYAPLVQPKWTGAGGKSMVVMYTGRGAGFGNVLQAFNMTFA